MIFQVVRFNLEPSYRSPFYLHTQAYFAPYFVPKADFITHNFTNGSRLVQHPAASDASLGISRTRATGELNVIPVVLHRRYPQHLDYMYL